MSQTKKNPNEKAICKQKEQELTNLWKFESCMLFKNYLIFNLCWTVQKWFGLVLVSIFFLSQNQNQNISPTKSSSFDLYSIFQNTIVSKTKNALSEIIWFHHVLWQHQSKAEPYYTYFMGNKIQKLKIETFEFWFCLSKPKWNKPETF